jgi:putative ABC transport system permease protein
MWSRVVIAVSRLRFGLFRQRVDDQVRREFEGHIDLLVDRYIRAGMTREEADVAARRQFGNSLLVREEIYDMNSPLPFLDTTRQDLRYGLRVLRQNPTFALVAILTLALGIGANAAIFQLVNALRLRSLPVERPYELVSIGIDQHGKGRVGRGYPGGRSIFTEPLWQEILSRQQAFSSLFAWGKEAWDLSTEGDVVAARGLYVSGGFFDGLGVRAHVGRVFTDADDRKGCGSPGAVLSHAFWQTRYGGNPDAIGKTIMLDRRRFDVIGVAQPGFFGVEVGRAFDVAIPLCAEPLLRAPQPATGRRDAWWLDVMGRLKPDWTIERAQVQLATISPDIFRATVSPSYKPDTAKNYTSFTLTADAAATGVSNLRRAYATQLWVLLGATGVVLLLTSVNLANLMLARATVRGREIAVRLAIGASRGRVVRQLLSESALVAGPGAAGGLLLARWISQALVSVLNAGPAPVFVDLTPDWRVFAFIVASAVVTCVLFGLGPALAATRRDPATTLEPGGRSSTDGRDAIALRRGLVVGQVALSIVLVVGAVLFARTLRNLGAVDLGFDPNVLVASVDLRRTTVPPEARTRTFADIVTRLREVPGVGHAAETLIVPLSGADWNGRIVRGGAAREGDVHFNEVGGGYFRAMATPLLSGRTFDDRDRPDTPPAAIVNETLVRRHFPNEDPIGQTFQMDVPAGAAQPVYHIVGVVKDAKYLGVREERTAAAVRFSAHESSAMFLPIAYLAASQNTMPPPDFRIVVRADVPLPSIARALTHAVTEVAPGAAVSYDAVANYVDALLVTERLIAWLSGFFGVLATLIAAIGLYGVMSYLVTRRRIEIGVRMALGAEPRTVIRMVLADSGRLLAVGVAIGVALAVVLLRYAASLLYGLAPSDATSFAIAIGALGIASLVAAWIPARRASTLAPAAALRE